MAESWEWAVTFEYETRQPDTLRGTATSGTGRGTAARAAREAQKAIKPRGWISMVVLVAKAGILNKADKPYPTMQSGQVESGRTPKAKETR